MSRSSKLRVGTGPPTNVKAGRCPPARAKAGTKDPHMSKRPHMKIPTKQSIRVHMPLA